MGLGRLAEPAPPQRVEVRAQGLERAGGGEDARGAARRCEGRAHETVEGQLRGQWSDGTMGRRVECHLSLRERGGDRGESNLQLTE
eukprot:483756-Pleurochrysis_carterae.AAC.7